MQSFEDRLHEIVLNTEAHFGVKTELMKKLDPIMPYLKWRQFSEDYFDKSVSWFYNKMHERDGRGGTPKFTDEELEILKGGLVDLADRIRKTADEL